MSVFHLPTDFKDVISDSDRSSYLQSQAREIMALSSILQEDDDQQSTPSPYQLYHGPHVFGDSRWTAGNSSADVQDSASETGNPEDSEWGEGGWPIDICRKADMGGLSGIAATSQRETARKSTLRPESLPFYPSLIDAVELPPQLSEYPALQPSNTHPTTNPTTPTDPLYLSPTSNPNDPVRSRQRPNRVAYSFTHDPVARFSLQDSQEGPDNIGSRDVLEDDMRADQLRDHWEAFQGGRMGGMNSQHISRYGPRFTM
ncbi:hypothetical protein L202_07549 [Cryptococcus amylolentus CBS 6039]|uniref:Uncharacterized protein n=2 Tax=Cryptococcus amylolentus TaxID=104669 RepID=A0A1E3HCL3_9TREE|nr:hypothetical protein L202_07549 [Cryptococcus amylolentus CBS 6039]ODN74087.1 hypothetical protein L202_07549 [Cryptococcus amylolentus CBS 6039]ODO00125.1 hypothetical protein I350_06750 [Cryptococcus amylolentus CBS 6273]